MVFKKIAAKYKYLLENHPGKTKVTQGGILVGVGDFLAQTLVEGRTFKDNTYDKLRTLRFASCAFFVITPMTRTWVDLILPKVFTLKNSKNSINRLALKKAAADALIFAPFIGPLVIALNMHVAGETETFSELVEEMKVRGPIVIKASWCYWPWVQLLNFRFVPAQQQASFIQFAALFWNTFLSWKAHQMMHEKEEKEKEKNKQKDKEN